MANSSLNPIIPGFAPDPSVCLIGDTFFLVNSTFHIFPGLPIYASKDLANWQHIGNAINRPGQLSLRAASTDLVPWADGGTEVATGGLYAPTIRHHNGTTYIICTNVVRHSTNREDGQHTENFFVWTTDIWSDKWSDPVYYKFNGIDPSLLFDDDGKVYIQGTQDPEFQIYNMEVDLETGAFLTEPRLIWAGWDKRWTEGPHLFKKDGWYYLLCAEGGTFATHMVSMARSRNVWGPYETYEGNPVWTAHGTANYIQDTGHADLVQDAKGDWWIVMLGVRMRKGPPVRFIMGRESFLSSVEWPTGGWPVVAPVEPGIQARELPARDGGLPISAKHGVDWVYLRDPVLTNYSFGKDSVELTATPTDLSAPQETVSFVGKRQRVLAGAASAVLRPVESAQRKGPLQAGLAMYKDEHRHIALGYDFDAQHVFFTLANQAKKLDRREEHNLAWTEGLTLRISYTETEYGLSYKAHPEDAWTSLGIVDTADMSGYDFTGPIHGVFAIGAEGSKVAFGEIRIQ